MAQTVTAIFDGEALRPTESLDLQPNREYRVTIEEVGTREHDDAAEDERYPLAKFAKYAMDMGIPDLAEQHDHYLYGTPKR